MRGNLCMRGHAQHDRVDATFIRVTLEHYGLYPADARTSRARIALLREFELARSQPCFAYILVRRGMNWNRWADESRNCRTRLTVYTGLSSISQCPDRGTTASCTLIATLRMITACNAPNHFSPPTAKTGIVSFTCSKILLSAASVENAANCAKPARMPPGCA